LRGKVRITGVCRLVDVLGEWGIHESEGRLQHSTGSFPQGNAKLLVGVELAVTFRSPLAWRILAGWPIACARVELVPEDVDALRIADGRTAEDWTTAVLEDQTDSGRHVRGLADAGREVVGPLTCTAQTADGTVARLQPPIVILDGWHRVAAWIAQLRNGANYA
jgi:hypothetical protein